MKEFQPNYENVVNAAKNITPERWPLYEHIISIGIIEKIVGKKFLHLLQTRSFDDMKEFFRHYTHFFKTVGYDTVSWEVCIGPVMPGSGALGGHHPGAIKNRKDFDNYPWDQIEAQYFSQNAIYFEALRDVMPEGMKAIGGPGNGIFECVQDVVGYENLCLISIDDPDLYKELFSRVGQTNYGIWKRFLNEFGDMYAVCRFGDDLGYKSSTMLSPADIKTNVIPQYKKIVDAVHSHNKPFLLHSCGCIFDVMDDIIAVAGIDAKHSNEDVIAPFTVWLEKYGDRIGNFGGIDMNILCQKDAKDIRDYTHRVMESSQGYGGVAFGSGNSIPDYVPVEGYMAMVNAVREFRGD